MTEKIILCQSEMSHCASKIATKMKAKATVFAGMVVLHHTSETHETSYPKRREKNGGRIDLVNTIGLLGHLDFTL